jgi:hypothetical protein
MAIGTSLSAFDPSCVNFHTTRDTLATIQKIITNQEKGVYFRFGDGDALLAIGDGDSYQSANSQLKEEMCQAFAIHGPNVIKGLTIHCKELNTLEPGMGHDIHELPYSSTMRFLSIAQSLSSQPLQDLYSAVALHHAAVEFPRECIRFLTFIKQYPCILVGNKNIPEELRNLLFGQTCAFVPTPDRQSYSEIDRIEQDTLRAAAEMPGYKVIITSMGCSGRALQKRLWYKLDDIFLFDFGSLMDALCGWETRAWITLTKFNRHAFLQRFDSI